MDHQKHCLKNKTHHEDKQNEQATQNGVRKFLGAAVI